METALRSNGMIIAGIHTIIPNEKTPETAATSKPKPVPAFADAATKWKRSNTKGIIRRNWLVRFLLGICSCQWSLHLVYEKHKSLVEADSVLRRYTLQMSILSFLGTALVVAHNDICFNAETLEFYADPSACPLGAQLLWLNLVLSVVFVHRLVLYYHCRSYIQMKEWNLATRWRAFIESRMIYFFVFELLVAIWQPVPGFQQIFGLGHKVVITLMVFRLYLVVRLLRDFSPAHINRKRIQSEFEMENRGFRADIRVDTVLKTQFYSHTQMTIFGTFFIMVVSLAYVIYILERQLWVLPGGGSPVSGNQWVQLSPLQKQPFKKTILADYSNCIWFVTVTATTVGYGDITPQTGPARIAAVASAICGIITTSLLVSVLTNRLAPTPFQQYVIDYLNRSEIRKKKREIAAVVIQTWWKTMSVNRKPRVGKEILGTRKSSLLTHVILSNMTKYHSALLDLHSLKAREARMKSNGPHDVTDFNGLTRAILAEQLEMRKSIGTMMEMIQRLSNALPATGSDSLLSKVEQISIPAEKEDHPLRNRKRNSDSSNATEDGYVFSKTL